MHLPVNSFKLRFILGLLAAPLVLCACGGGGGSTTESAPPSGSAPPPAAASNTFSVGGTVNGLNGSILLVNNAQESVNRSANGAFSFPTALANGSRYSVTIADASISQECTATNASGTVSSANVTNIGINCRNRVWSVGQQLESGDESVRLMKAGMDDQGRVVALFVKSNGVRNVLYATHGRPGQASGSPEWTAPVTIDAVGSEFHLPASFASTHLSLDVAGNGRAVVAWIHRFDCTTGNYRSSSNCLDLFTATFDPATSTWGAPIRVGEAPGGDGFSGVNVSFEFVARTNGNGDSAILFGDWVRGPNGANSYEIRPAVAWRTSGAAVLNKRRFDDLTGYSNTDRPFDLTLNDAGRIVVVGRKAAATGGVNDIVAYSGTLSTGVSAASATPIDSGLSDATYLGLRSSSNGATVALWRQNLGNGLRIVSASLGASANSWSVPYDLAPSSSDINIYFSPGPAGDLILYQDCAVYRWRSADSSWSGRTGLPNDCAVNSNGFRGFSSEGFLHVLVNSGLWRSYDTSSNIMGHSAPTSNSSSQDFVMSFEQNSLQAGNLFGTDSYGVALLSPNGIGAYLGLATFDQLPTSSQTRGIGRSAVTNLWGFYLR